MRRIDVFYRLSQKLLWEWIFSIWIFILMAGCVSGSEHSESKTLEPYSSPTIANTRIYIEDIPTSTPTQVALELTAAPTLPKPDITKVSSTITRMVSTPSPVPNPTVPHMPFSVSSTVNQMLFGNQFWDPENNQVLPGLEGMSFSLYPWSPDGKALTAFLRIEDSPYSGQLVLVNLETAEVVFPPNAAYASSRLQLPNNALLRAPLWSPNGQYLLYSISTEEDQDFFRLVIYDLIAQQEVFLSAPIQLESLSGWSFDSQQIAYIRWGEPGTETENTTVLELIDLPSFLVHPFNQPDALSFGAAHWSPTDKQLALYVGYVDNYSTFTPYAYNEIYLVDVPTGRFEQLKGRSTREDDYYSNPANPEYLVHGTPWSPDGQSIVYSDRGLICTLVISSREETCFTEVDEQLSQLGAVGAQYPGWSPSGEWVGFVMKLDSEFCSPMAAVRTDGSDFRFTDLAKGECSLFGPIWSPAK